jgi:hypothetical protein
MRVLPQQHDAREVLMQQIVCGDYSAEISPIYRNWTGQALYRVAVYKHEDLIYENLEGDPCEAVRVAEACIDWHLRHQFRETRAA